MENKYSILHLHDSTGDFHFKSQILNEFFEAAYKYYFYAREQVGTYSLDSIALNFRNYSQIDVQTFSDLCKAIGKNESLQMVVEFDFENDIVLVWEQDAGEWKNYNLKDVSSAMKKSTNGERYTLGTQKALFNAYIEGKEISIFATPKPKNDLSKTEFIQNCFKELLNDGQPHKYSEIVEYTKQKSLPTEFCDGIDRTGVVLYIGSLLKGDNAEYVRLKHGLYQKKTPELILNKNIEVQGSSIFSVVDDITEMQKYLKTICNDGCAAFPQIKDNIQSAFKTIDECLDRCIDELSFCMADIENLEFDEDAMAQAPKMNM